MRPARPTRPTRPIRLLILQGLYERTAHRGLRRPDRRNERRAENRRNQRDHRAHREFVVEPQPRDVVMHDLEDVLKVNPTDAESSPKTSTAKLDAPNPDCPANLPGQSACARSTRG